MLIDANLHSDGEMDAGALFLPLSALLCVHKDTGFYVDLFTRMTCAPKLKQLGARRNVESFLSLAALVLLHFKMVAL